VAYEDGRLRLLITDDGRGVSPEDALRKARAGHLGIVGMRERARALGGEFLLSSPPTGGTAGGTRIDVTLPAPPLSAS
jgi:signal transduction histidine kinase